MAQTTFPSFCELRFRNLHASFATIPSTTASMIEGELATLSALDLYGVHRGFVMVDRQADGKLGLEDLRETAWQVARNIDFGRDAGDLEVPTLRYMLHVLVSYFDSNLNSNSE